MEAYLSTPGCKQNKQPDIVLDSEWMTRYARRPLLYHWRRGGESLYVGQSQSGISRPSAPYHERLRGFADGDTIELYLMAPGISPRDLSVAERAMIDEHGPALNTPGASRSGWLPQQPQEERLTYRERAARFQAEWIDRRDHCLGRSGDRGWPS
jgi:hypothetical protein